MIMAYFIGGYNWSGESQLDRFISEGIWENGYREDKYQEIFDEIKVGDFFALKATYTTRKNEKRSWLKIVNIGKVTQIINSYTLKVDWLHTPEQKLTDITWYANTLVRIEDKSHVSRIFQVAIDMVETDSILYILQAKHQIILQGAPGTGKTYTAKKVAERLTDRERIKLVQFHPSYTYEDFVRGIVVNTNNGVPEYTSVNKVLAQFAKDAWDNYVLSQKNKHEIKTTLIKVDNAYESLAKLLNLYEMSKPKKEGIDSLAFVAPSAKIGENVYIGAFAYIGENAVIGDNTQIYPHTFVGDGVKIGKGCLLYSNVNVYHDCRIGNECILHSGAVIGADGFGFAPTPNGYDKIPQIGIVILEDKVDIGANTCVDRATMGATVIHSGAKIDNLVQIAHNDEVGSHTVMAAQVGIAGSTKIGEWCMFGGQVGIAGHIKIGDRVNLGAQSGVPSSIKSDNQLIGTPPMELKPYFKAAIVTKKLPDMYTELNKLRKEVEELKQLLNK